MLKPKYHALLRGTSEGDEIVHFSSEQHREVASRIAKEFGFEFMALNSAPMRMSTFYEYPHEFRVWCCKERHSVLE